MSIELPNQQELDSVTDIAKRVDALVFGGDLTDLNASRTFIQEPVIDMINRLVGDGWFTGKQLIRIADENGIGHVSKFLIEVSQLAIGAKESELSEDELSELKSNVGLIDNESLMSALKNRNGS